MIHMWIRMKENTSINMFWLFMREFLGDIS